MIKSNILYFVIGVLFTIIIFLSINATVSSDETGRYEHAIMSGGVSILDTKTGILKLYSPPYNKVMKSINYNE